MTNEEYLELIKKLNILIDDEILEKENLFVLATKTTQVNDDMPHAPGVSDKVSKLSVKIAMKEEEIDHIIDVLVDLRDEIKEQIRKLPADECDVLYRYYVLNEGLFDIADSKHFSEGWIKKLKYRGVRKIQVIKSAVYEEACKLLY